MITIGMPRIEEKTRNAVLSANISLYQEDFDIWYSVPIEYREYLCKEKSDAFLVAMLVFAMSKGEDVKCEQAVSEKLYFSLIKYLIPFLNRINPDLKKINIICDLDDSVLKSEKKIGTGISCGVDSLSTIEYHGKDSEIGKYKINQLTLFNSGYYGNKDNNEDKFSKYRKQSVNFSKEFGYPLLFVNSNVSNVTKYKFIKTHTYLSCSVVLALQKMFSVYYYASGYPIYNFKASFDSPAYYDTFLLDCISNENTKFISANTIMTRLEKIELLLNNKHYLNHLYVCTTGNPPDNCGKCEKCVRTLLAIDSFSALDQVKDRFNLSVYHSNRYFNLSLMILRKKNRVFYKEIFNNFKKEHVSIPIFAYLLLPLAFLYEHIYLKSYTKLRIYLSNKLSKEQREKVKKILKIK